MEGLIIKLLHFKTPVKTMLFYDFWGILPRGAVLRQDTRKERGTSDLSTFKKLTNLLGEA